MTVGVNCGGGHRTWLRELLVCLWGAPAHVYKGEGREAGGQEGRAMGRVLLGLLVQVGFAPPFPFSTRGNMKERKREREGEHRPLLLVLFGLPRRGARGHPPRASLSLP